MFVRLHLLLGLLASVIAFASARAKGRPAVEIVAQIGHSSVVTSIAFSPDGGKVLSGSLDSTLKLWDVKSGGLVRTFLGHSEPVTAVAFPSHGETVLSASWDKTLRLWDAGTGRVLRTLTGHAEAVRAAAFSPDDSRILSASADRTLRLWDASSGQALRTFAGHLDEVNAIAFSADGSKVLSGSADRTLKLWDTQSGQLLRTFAGHAREVKAVAFSPDSARIISGSEDGTLKLWDAATGSCLHTFTGTAISVAFSRDGRTILSAGDGTPKLWDVTTGDLIRSMQGDASATSAVFSPDGTTVLAGEVDHALELWNAATGQVLTQFGSKLGAVFSADLSGDGRRIASGSRDNRLKVWDAATGRLLHNIEVPNGLNASALSPDGRMIIAGIAGSEDPPRPERLEVWDAVNGRLLRTITGDYSGVNTIRFSPDGRTFLTGGIYDTDEALMLWNAATGRPVRSFNVKGSASSAVFSSDGRQLASAGGHTLELWDAATGRLLRSFKLPGDADAVAFAPDGKTLFSAAAGSLQAWSTVTGKLLRVWKPGRVGSIAVSPNGLKVLTGGWDTMLREFDVATGKPGRVLSGHSGTVTSLAFSRDGQRIVSGSEDGTIRVWPASDGRDVVTLLAARLGERLVLTSSGFFDYDGEVETFAHLVRGVEVIGLGQVHQSLFSPDLVREALGGDPNGEVRQAAGIVSLEQVLDSGPAPDVAITSPAPGITSAADLVLLSTRISDRGKGIGRIEWRVNGLTVGVCPAACLGPDGHVARELALDAGENRIEVVAYDARNFLASAPARTAIRLAGSSDTAMPTLHVLAIGINNYVDPGGVAPGETVAMQFPKLKLAVSDAEALVSAFGIAGRGLYGNVRVRTVLDEEATAAKLDSAVTEFAQGVAPRDTFVLFAAAHGYSVSGRFYLIPQDYEGGPDPETLKARAIDQAKLQDWIANRIRAKKALILLDTCESGALTNGYLRSRIDGPASDAGIGRLHEATGRPIFTAAAEGQAAVEYGDLRHGVFTAALLDGFRHAEATPDGAVMLSSLVAYVQNMVPKLVQDPGKREALLRRGPAGGGQSVRFGSRGEDFAIVRR